MLRFLCATAARAPLRTTAVALSARIAPRTAQPSRAMATKQRIVTAASIRRADDRSEQGVAPIDTDGEIALVDDASELQTAESSSKRAKEILETLPQPRKPKPAARTEKDKRATAADGGADFATAASTPSSSSRSTASGAWDDLSKPPTPPSSSTHSTAPRPETMWDALEPKGAWQPPRKTNARERAHMRRMEEEQQQEGEEQQPEQRWNNIKGAAMPELGWAEARARTQPKAPSADAAASSSALSASASATPPGVVWSDAEFVSIFPHLRAYTGPADSSSDDSPAAAGVTPAASASAEIVTQRIADLRRKYPELEKLHYASTMVKVRKWRELLGATRMQMPAVEGAQPLTAAQQEAKTEDAAPSSSSSADASSETHPANALHHRYFQPDLFLTAEQVSLMLLRQRDLLYANIERVIVPRLSVIRSHLPGINMSSVLLRNPGLLLTDVAASLPLKLRELKALFPEVQLVTLIEKDASILSRSAASHLVPRLNLFASVTGYSPRHVVQFLAVEHPQLLAHRWNKLKRIEVVREPKFWEWWEQQPEAKLAKEAHEAAAAAAAVVATESASTKTTESEAGSVTATETTADTPTAAPVDALAAPSAPAAVAAAPSVTASAPARSPSSLPFSLYFDLLSWEQDRFDSVFPWFSVQYSTVEKELFAAQQNAAREHKARKQADDEGRTMKQAKPGTAARHALSTVSAAVLASVPGNPQPLSLALGLTPDSNLSRDELRAKQRMEYLALKAQKREAKEAAKDSMRAREREHQQKKMRDYTQKFQRYRQTSLAREAHIEGKPEPHQMAMAAASNEGDESNFSSSSSSSSSSRPPRKQASSGFDESSYPDLSSGSSSGRGRSSFAPRSDSSYAERRGSGSGGYGANRSGGGDRGGRGGYGARSSFDRSARQSDDDHVASFSRDGGGGRDRARGDRGGFAHTHQKNRAGDALTQRHSSHPQGTVERFGARPVPFTPQGQQMFGGGVKADSAVAAPTSAAAPARANRASSAPPPRDRDRERAGKLTAPTVVINADGTKSIVKPAPKWKI